MSWLIVMDWWTVRGFVLTARNMFKRKIRFWYWFLRIYLRWILVIKVRWGMCDGEYEPHRTRWRNCTSSLY